MYKRQLAGIAHDLKTPLSRLRLRAEMLVDQKAGAGIERDVESMSAIVEQFLAYAQSGDTEAREVSVDRHLRGLVQPFAEQSSTCSTTRSPMAPSRSTCAPPPPRPVLR